MKKRYLVFLVIIFSAVCALVFNVFYREARNTAIKKLNEEQVVHARQAALGIEDFFRTWTGILNSFAKMDEIINTDAGGKRYIKLFSEAHHEQIMSITRMDENGTILHTCPFSRAIGSNISEQKHVKEILRTHKPVISDVFRTVQGFDAVALHVPVFKGTVFKGTIAIVINFEALAKRYLDVIKIGETGYAWVISRDGIQLYSMTTGFTGNSVFENYKAYPSVLAMVNDMLKGQEGAAEYTFDRIGDRNVGPIKKYAVYKPIQLGNTFWSIVVTSGEQDVLSGLISFRNRLILVVGAIFLFGIVFSLLGVKAWLIVKEEEKRKKAEEELNKYREHLEELVNERTAELHESEKVLTHLVEDLDEKSEFLREANEKLKEVDRLKSMFIASMSHELRTPLNSVIGFSSVLLNQWAGAVNDEQKNLLSTISRSGKYLLSLINDVIDVSKIEAGTIDVHVEDFDLYEVIAEVVELMKKEMDDKQLELNVDSIHAGMHTDRRRLFQSVLNLVSNAVKFTERGSVRVSARKGVRDLGLGSMEKEPTPNYQPPIPDGDFIEISVADTGIGIREEDIPKLFTPFVRLDSPLRTTVLGTGLGLYLTRKLVTEILKGDIFVESRYEEGSTFTLRVPAKIDQ